MDSILLTDLLRMGHLAGLAVGLGLALCADLLAVRSFFVTISERDVWILRSLHWLIMAGVAILWGTGLGLLYIRTGFAAEAMSPKLMVKLGVVLLLTCNALIIGMFALPSYAAHQGQRFGHFALTERLRLSVIAGLSLSCWASALALGAISQLKPLPLDQLEMLFAPFFAVVISAVVFCGLGAGLLERLRRDLPNPRDWPQDTAPRDRPGVSRVRTVGIQP